MNPFKCKVMSYKVCHEYEHLIKSCLKCQETQSLHNNKEQGLESTKNNSLGDLSLIIGLGVAHLIPPKKTNKKL